MRTLSDSELLPSFRNSCAAWKTATCGHEKSLSLDLVKDSEEVLVPSPLRDLAQATCRFWARR